jgi:hypothetical protein
MRKTYLVALLLAGAAAAQTDEGWPRQVVREGATLTTYQPQVDDWKDFQTLSWRMAFRLTPAGGQEAVGVMRVRAQTDVDRDSHMVVIHDLKIEGVDFPTADPGTAAQLDALLRTFVPETVEIALERVIACTPKQQMAETTETGSAPPRILISQRPAVVLEVDGQPKMKAIPGTKLERVSNTASRAFRDTSDGQFYLLTGDGWMAAAKLAGPWSAARRLPKDINKAARDGKAAEAATVVFYSEEPAEVIVFDGEPAFTTIAGTKLSYANNTRSYVFRDGAEGQFYYLTAGRWFRAASLEGPWTFATPQLPTDFTRIPRRSPAGSVLAWVPGTEEQQDALLMAQIPRRSVVSPLAAAQVDATYDGEPKFAPIERTPMTYATNTEQKVIELYGHYYLCQDGVWFDSGSATGVWSTATAVPPEIYTIPRGSPMYEVTYVRQYARPDGEILASYTAGYPGMTQETAFAGGAAGGAARAGGNRGSAGAAGGELYAGRDGNVYRATGSGWEMYGNGEWQPVGRPSQGSAARSAEPDAIATSGAEDAMESLQREMQDRMRGEETCRRRP